MKYRKNSRDVTLDRAVYGALLFGSALGTAEDLRATTFGDWGDHGRIEPHHAPPPVNRIAEMVIDKFLFASMSNNLRVTR